MKYAPLIIAVLLIFSIIVTFEKCNRKPLPNPDLLKLEQLEKENKALIKKFNEQIKKEIDTVYIERTRVRVKNDSIFIYQKKVGEKPKDSAAKFLVEWTSKTAIHD